MSNVNNYCISLDIPMSGGDLAAADKCLGHNITSNIPCGRAGPQKAEQKWACFNNCQSVLLLVVSLVLD